MLQRDFTAEEFQELQAFARIEPFGDSNRLLAIIAALVHNALYVGGKTTEFEWLGLPRPVNREEKVNLVNAFFQSLAAQAAQAKGK